VPTIIIWSCSKLHKYASIVLGAVLTICILASAAGAAEHARAARPLCIVLGSPSTQTEQLQPVLTSRYPGAAVVTTASMCPDGSQLALSVGPAALRDVTLSAAHYPTISLFVTREEYRNIVGTHTDISAVYAEVSPNVQLQLVKQLYQRPVRVAVMLSEETDDLRGLFASAAAQAGLTLQIIRATRSSDPGRAVATAGNFDALVIIPDPSVLSAMSFRTILEATYRRGEGVIGFSAGQVGAGTLAAPFASLSDILAQLDEMLGAYRTTGDLPAPTYPRYWGVAINESVAHSLDLVVTDEARQMASRPNRADEAPPGLPSHASGDAPRSP
jgi:putative ABC transport system substrate-binding protein